MLCTVRRTSLFKHLPKLELKTVLEQPASSDSHPEQLKMAYNAYKTDKITDSQAPPLIVMHGLFGSKSNWNSLCKVFVQKTNPSRSAVCVDARNHGNSPHSAGHSYRHLVEDKRLLMEELQIEKAALLGHSMGGRAVMLFALTYPQLVDKLIVADISPIRNTGFDSMREIFDALEKVTFPSADVSPAQARVDLDKQLAQRIEDKGIRAFLLTNLVKKEDGSYHWRVNVPVLVQSFEEHISKFPNVQGAEFKGPVLFVAGGNSDYLKNSSSVFVKLYQRNVSSDTQQNDKLYESVNLAYASYENTRSVPVSEIPPPLLVMHGLFGSKANWNSLCKIFHMKTAPQRKVIAVDARNHGDSPHTKFHSYNHLAEDVKALMSHLRIKRVALLGHSMGGRTLMLFALKYPSFVDKLIVGDISPISTSPNLKSMPALFTIMQKVNLPKNVPMSIARMTADIQLAQSINDKGLRTFLLTNLIQNSNGSYSWRLNIPALAENFHTNIAKFPDVGTASFNGPVLFVGGGASDFIQKTDHPHIKKLFPNAEFKYIEGAGHWLHSEKPAEFLQICVEFLNKQITHS